MSISILVHFLTIYSAAYLVVVIMRHGRETVDNFLLHLNRQHANGNFTMEIDNNGALPFLGILVKHDY